VVCYFGIDALDLFARAVPIPLDARISTTYSRMSATSSSVSRSPARAHRIDASTYSGLTSWNDCAPWIGAV